jgi:hypothetical protein
MATIVSIANDTKRSNNDLGDIVDIYDNDVELGSAYSTFLKTYVKGLDKTEIRKILSDKLKNSLIDISKEKDFKYTYSVDGLSKESETALGSETDKEAIKVMIDKIGIKW